MFVIGEVVMWMSVIWPWCMFACGKSSYIYCDLDFVRVCNTYLINYGHQRQTCKRKITSMYSWFVCDVCVICGQSLRDVVLVWYGACLYGWCGSCSFDFRRARQRNLHSSPSCIRVLSSPVFAIPVSSFRVSTMVVVEVSQCYGFACELSKAIRRNWQV